MIGVWTIGYGTTIYPNGSRVQKGDAISAAKANSLLVWDVDKFARGVDSAVGPVVSLKNSNSTHLCPFHTTSDSGLCSARLYWNWSRRTPTIVQSAKNLWNSLKLKIVSFKDWRTVVRERPIFISLEFNCTSVFAIQINVRANQRLLFTVFETFQIGKKVTHKILCSFNSANSSRKFGIKEILFQLNTKTTGLIQLNWGKESWNLSMSSRRFRTLWKVIKIRYNSWVNINK